MAIHKDATLTDIHSLTARTYADVAARDADTAFQVATNVDKMVRVDSPVSYFILASVGPAVWTETSTGTDVALNTIHRSSDGSDHSFLDQSVTVASSPIFASPKLSGQLVVGSTAAPATGASLDLKATNKALLHNRLTIVQRDAIAPVAGMAAFIIDNSDLEFYNGVAWQSMGGGDVVGPPSATDNAIARFNGTTGKNIQNSGIIISDVNALSGITQLTVDDVKIDGNTISSINNKPLSLLPAGFNDLVLGPNIKISSQAVISDADMLFRAGATNKFKFDRPVQVQDSYEIAPNSFTMVNVVDDRVKLGQLTMRSQAACMIDLDINITGLVEIGGTRRFTFAAQDGSPGGLRTIKPFIAQGVDSGDDYTIEAEVSGSNMSIYLRRILGTAVPTFSRYVIRFSGVGNSPSNAPIWTNDGATTDTVTAPTIFWPTALISQLNLPGSAGVLELGTGSTPVNILGRLTVTDSLNIVNVYVKADLPSTLVAGTNYVLHAPITLAAGEELTFPGTGVSEISSTNLGTNILTYTGPNTLLQGTSIEAISLNVQINSTGTGTLFGITGSGSFAFIFANSGGFSGWDDLGTITGFGAVGMNFATVSDFGAGLKLVTTDGFFLTHSTWFNFSDSGADFLTFDANILNISITNVGFTPIGTERIFNINSSASVVAAISNILGPDDSVKYFNSAGLDKTSPGVIVVSSENIADSTITAEIEMIGNTAATSIPLAGAMVEINSTPNWIATDVERLTVATDGCASLTALSPAKLKIDANINLEPVTASKNLSVRVVLISPPPFIVTFTNATNLINETATALSDGDLISFRDTAGVLPAEIRKDVIYFVVSKLTDSFQIAYTSGGSAIAFTDDGTPTNSYKTAELHGSTPTNTIAASSPRDLIPQATVPATTGSESCLVVINNTDTVDITVNSGYQRYFE